MGLDREGGVGGGFYGIQIMGKSKKGLDIAGPWLRQFLFWRDFMSRTLSWGFCCIFGQNGAKVMTIITFTQKCA